MTARRTWRVLARVPGWAAAYIAAGGVCYRAERHHEAAERVTRVLMPDGRFIDSFGRGSDAPKAITVAGKGGA